MKPKHSNQKTETFDYIKMQKLSKKKNTNNFKRLRLQKASYKLGNYPLHLYYKGQIFLIHKKKTTNKKMYKEFEQSRHRRGNISGL